MFRSHGLETRLDKFKKSKKMASFFERRGFSLAKDNIEESRL